MLILARRIGESIMIGDQVEISVVDIKGDQVKLGINAPTQVKVYRKEVYAAIQQENRAAAAATPESLPRLEGLLGTKAPPQRPPDAPQRPPGAPQRPPDDAPQRPPGAPTGRDPKAR
jgi:carbon storage regulator